MAKRLFHKDHGFVITADEDQIKELLAKGAELVDKCSEYGKIVEEIPTPTKPAVIEKRPPPMKRKYGN